MSEMQEPGDAMAADVAKVSASQTSFAARVRNYFLTGLVVAGPLAITVWLVWSIITWVDDFVRPMIPPTYRPESYMPWPIPGTGLIIAFVALTLLGFLTANLVGRTLVELGESLLSRMPIVRPIYKTMKQIFEIAVLEDRFEFPESGAGGISGAGHVVARVSVAAAWRRCGEKAAAGRTRLGVHAVYAKPDNRVLLLREAQRPDRARYYG